MFFVSKKPVAIEHRLLPERGHVLNHLSRHLSVRQLAHCHRSRAKTELAHRHVSRAETACLFNWNWRAFCLVVIMIVLTAKVVVDLVY